MMEERRDSKELAICKALLYYYSGTGNTYQTALWVREELEKKRVHTQVLSLREGVEGEKIEGSNHLVGILSPVHAFTVPFFVIRSTLSLPSYGNKAFVLVTRGGTKVGRFILPGFEGTAAYLLAILLKAKGYSIMGVMAIDMPSNWTVLHPGLKNKDSVVLRERARERVRDSVSSLLRGRVFKGLLPLLLGIFLLPISLSYLLLGRFFLSRLFFANGRCKDCGLCIKYCPHQAIKRVQQRPYFTYGCMSCMRCMAYCRERAIEGSHSFALLMVLCLRYLSIPLGERVLELLYPSVSFFHYFIVQFSLYTMISLFVLTIMYSLFHYLLLLPPINYVFTKTSLTHYFRRYHDIETEVKDLK